MKKIVIVWLIVLCSGLHLIAQKPIRDLKPTIILISLDGFHPRYLDNFKPPVLNELAKKGVRAKWLIPAFPTKTFPNHYTIATGLYPENHGIIENNIYDAGFDALFGLSRTEEVQNARWWLGEPIWVTAEKQGQRAGAFFFPGTEAPIMNVLPTFWKKYDGKIPNAERVDTILSWLDLPQKERPTLYTLYFSDTDDSGHAFSPESKEVRDDVLKVDGEVGRLVDGLKKRKIDKKVNLIIVSDHGMATVNQRNAVFLDDAFDLSKTERILWTGEIVQIFPKAGAQKEIIGNLQSKVKHAQCWEKANIPARFHYNASPRIAPVVCSADEGWILTSRARYEEMKKREDFGRPRGAHGYDNQLASMRATFIAHGRAFRKGKVVEPFENVEIYILMCKILGLTPAKNDGNFENVKKLLR
ncbi:MAG TPA: ectonucleotide pyrophosphatase/phosphodiesterase [Pyrinomonadaceae bacterium]|nr:ectonucleotide pyrophosphatase/phosphodiesterase [Pyrinomonadaceae bacterium]